MVKNFAYKHNFKNSKKNRSLSPPPHYKEQRVNIN